MKQRKRQLMGMKPKTENEEKEWGVKEFKKKKVKMAGDETRRWKEGKESNKIIVKITRRSGGNERWKEEKDVKRNGEDKDRIYDIFAYILFLKIIIIIIGKCLSMEHWTSNKYVIKRIVTEKWIK